MDDTRNASGPLGSACAAVGIEVPISHMLNAPNGVALDSSGQIVVTNTGSNSIVVFPATAAGNQSPNETIQGNATALSSPIGLAVVTVAGPP